MDARDYNVPNDGAYYTLDPSWNIGDNYWLVSYAWGRWDGSQWAWTQQYYTVTDYRAFAGLNTGVCVATHVG